MKSILLLAMLYASLFAFVGKVVSIHDGDTITILQGKQQIKVRLHGIDAPEKKQAYGNKSRQFLSNLIAGKEVEVKEKGKDRYKRTIGTIYLNGTDINAQMVASGYAWAYVKFSKDYIKQEREARRQKLGLWRDKKPIPPWEFRKR
ncbi:thermonuclease family protein [Campylobacter californiensis]|uniref:thermonuclease family protein n=1 Tax=Campylobacter californiensis TaxID=1032243 RepID=UPI001472F1BD|nr:thermonuclease family protein [Campylobacter sp. RM12916]MBE3610511.1 thermonuclease family protein [Campylobacter sp. RM12916]